ncbi:PIG-L family deacetylase [Pontibacter sp. G13]|uniref:PIG-L family deacetylase n=1 Tax=Pontibacter sp. G13 TaxID=3074898 RepID=UPI00288C28E4|nr:PIG-L family deacetylase [Pontibacter sp. G13]WNJ18592.1 PIG-L family deacetylase [Pontibacter sp. G13]
MNSTIFRIITVLCLGVLHLQAIAQAPMPPASAAQIQHELGQLDVLGSVLYVAAHPDDENTRLIAWLAKGRGYRTAYLSLTRGDGGQNLIGDEKGPSLGILRTQELLAARRTDGGEQMFSRAYDFGYSKGPEETLEIWDKDKVLSDVVWAIRKFQPDVIVTRFPGPEKGGGGHGHHTSSAMLAQEAFHLAADPNSYPDQLDKVGIWQAKRLLWNTWQPYRDESYDFSHTLSVDIGQYDPLLGKSYGEIAAEARSMHKCQAFGVAKWRGSMMEYLQHELGDEASEDLFDGIESTWNRLGEGELDMLAKDLFNRFNPTQPEASVPGLLEFYHKMDGKKGYWYEQKRKAVRELILQCAGIWMELDSELPVVAMGDSADFTVKILKRNPGKVTLKRIQLGAGMEDFTPNKELVTNMDVEQFKRTLKMDGVAISQPYWLRKPQAKGIFDVDDRNLIGLPENPPVLNATVELDFDGTVIEYALPVTHPYVDRAVGELYRPFNIAPPVTVNFSDNSYLFADNTPQDIDIQVKSFAAMAEAEVTFEVPKGWTVEPASMTFSFDQAGQERKGKIKLTPSSNQSSGSLKAIVSTGGFEGAYSQLEIAYGHIPTQMVFYPSVSELVRVDLKKKGEKIGYIVGSGDEIPTCLEAIGYQVDLLSNADITLDNLTQYDAVIAGIRAYNKNKKMPYLQEIIFQYVQQGGTYLVQYNTTYDLSTRQPGPYPLTLSRNRVTKEEATPTFLVPDHPAFNTPNKITEADFDGWIQERGLYFPSSWDDAYTPLLEFSDPGETPTQGSLLVTKYGDGYFVYTGLSMFRELPAGVPGAYRLFVNLISLGQ